MGDSKTIKLKMKKSVEKYLSYLNKPSGDDRKELFAEPKKVSVQVVLHKIPNLMNEKRVLW